MIPFDFIYCCADTLKEAVEAYEQFQSERKNPLYYAGGSEIITLCRTGSIRPGAVIDIKNIPECMRLSIDKTALHIGSTCSLNQIKESGLFPLLGLCCGRIADHTNQCRITLGGNLCGTIIYREASLPLFLSDADVTLCGPEGVRTVLFQSVFQKRMLLHPGELIVQVHIPAWILKARYFHIKKTANESIDYPLVDVAGVCRGNTLRAAFSGICSFPFHSEQIDAVLNDRSLSCDERVEKAAALLPEPAYSDAEASGEYRMFVFKNTLRNILEDLEHDAV